MTTITTGPTPTSPAGTAPADASPMGGPIRRSGAPRTFWRDTAAGFRRRVSALVGLTLVILFLLAAIVGQFGTPASTNRNNLAQRLRAPSAEHVFGTDGFGRDMLFRVLQGAPLALAVGVVSVAIGSILVKRDGPFEPMKLLAWMSMLTVPQVLVMSAIFESGQWASLNTATWHGWMALLYTIALGGIAGFGKKARDGKLTIDEMTGGTFTITNGGTFGSMMSTPIVNPPQAAILGMHNIIQRPMAINGQVVIRPMMYLALSYDHRLIDGKEAVTFLVTIKNLLEDPARLLLDI